ncbi:hypothetical protein N9F57_00680 [Gammaproteobacteria bacterium]|nr:hypothetical protein [Gammaproteobacteria bacterium]
MVLPRWDIVVLVSAPAGFDPCSAGARVESGESTHEYVVGPACCAPAALLERSVVCLCLRLFIYYFA